MSTSLADLLDALDSESRSPRLTPADSTAALGHLSRSIDLLAENHVDSAGTRQPASLSSLGRVAGVVSAAWPSEAGRCAQLAGAVQDVLAVHIRQLNEPDLKVAAVTLTACTYRFALCIQANSASHAPALDDLIANTTEMRRRQAAHPASAADCTTLFRPLSPSSLPDLLDPASILAESVEAVLDFLCQTGRSPLSVRQVIAVCRMSEVVSGRLEEVGGLTDSTQAAGWRQLREQVALLSDGKPDPSFGGNDRLMSCAATADRTMSAMSVDSLQHCPTLDRTVLLLPSVAKQIENELRRIQHTLVVPVGARPLVEERVGTWLRGIAYLPNAHDLEPIFAAISDLTDPRTRIVEASIDATLGVG